jgi:hypothetical protein
MTGLDLVMKHLLGTLGLSEEDLERVKTALPEIAKQAPAMVSYVMSRADSIDARLLAIGQRLDTIEAILVTDAASPAAPPMPGAVADPARDWVPAVIAAKTRLAAPVTDVKKS